MVKKNRSLIACAVRVLADDPACQDEGELIDRMKQVATRRGVRWRYGSELTEALAQAWRYDPRGAR